MKLRAASLLVAAGMLLLGMPASAQDRGPAPTVLVIDASNSMWGRIEGRAKSEIAREAVTSLVGTMAKTTRLGLIAYGHRRAADCADIETVLPISAADRGKVEAATARLTPRGKTPLTGALKEAAGLVPQGGTVVLVTDGIETCGGDPCAAAEELKRKNANFVAHVVGFDLSAIERAKVSCIADRTGGTFVVASNARELGDALKTTAQAKAKPAIATRSVQLEATDGGRAVVDASFTITRVADGAVVADGISAGAFSLQPGRYRISAFTASKSGQSEAEVTKDAPAKITVALTGALPAASLKPAQMRVAATGALEVGWTGPNGKGDYIVFARSSGEALETHHFSYVQDGNPVKVRVPGEPGDYELRYVWGTAGAVLARMKIAVTPVTATLDAPPKGAAGAEIAVTFNGPNAEEDWVGLAKPGSDPSSYEAGAWQYANSGSPARLRLPVEPGAYEIRYVSGLDPKVLTRKVVTVEPASASVTAPPRGMAGTSITVGFRGEGADDSFIGVVKKGAGPSAYIGGAFERPNGNEVTLRLPADPGAYEVRFVLEANGTYKVLASTPITVEPATASLTAPDRVKRDTEVSIGFMGPKGEGDYVTIVPAKDAADAYLDFAYATPDANVVSVKAPDQPGIYEVRYVMTAPGEAGAVVLARKPIRVE